MNYTTSRARLLRIFRQKDFATLLREQRQIMHTVQTLPDAGAIRVVFPGYKTDLAKGQSDYCYDD